MRPGFFSPQSRAVADGNDPMVHRPTIPEVREIVREELDRFCARIEAARRPAVNRGGAGTAFHTYSSMAGVTHMQVEDGLTVERVNGLSGQPVLVIRRGA